MSKKSTTTEKKNLKKSEEKKFERNISIFNAVYWLKICEPICVALATFHHALLPLDLLLVCSWCILLSTINLTILTKYSQILYSSLIFWFYPEVDLFFLQLLFYLFIYFLLLLFVVVVFVFFRSLASFGLCLSLSNFLLLSFYFIFILILICSLAKSITELGIFSTLKY